VLAARTDPQGWLQGLTIRSACAQARAGRLFPCKTRPSGNYPRRPRRHRMRGREGARPSQHAGCAYGRPRPPGQV